MAHDLFLLGHFVEGSATVCVDITAPADALLPLDATGPGSSFLVFGAVVELLETVDAAEAELFDLHDSSLKKGSISGINESA